VVFVGVAGSAAERPAKNSFLADSVHPLGHGDPAQQDALPVPGPENPGPELRADEIQYAPTGPAQFGAYTSGPYPDGRRVFWSNGLDRIVKVAYDGWLIIPTEHGYDVALSRNFIQHQVRYETDARPASPAGRLPPFRGPLPASG
jgi:hypothetical protein